MTNKFLWLKEEKRRKLAPCFIEYKLKLESSKNWRRRREWNLNICKASQNCKHLITRNKWQIILPVKLSILSETQLEFVVWKLLKCPQKPQNRSIKICAVQPQCFSVLEKQKKVRTLNGYTPYRDKMQHISQKPMNSPWSTLHTLPQVNLGLKPRWVHFPSTQNKGEKTHEIPFPQVF